VPSHTPGAEDRALDQEDEEPVAGIDRGELDAALAEHKDYRAFY
jgi:hypothetical protein